MVFRGEMEYKDLLGYLVKMELLDYRVLQENRVPLDHKMEVLFTPGGGRALVQMLMILS